MALNRRYESPSIYHVTVARLAPTWTVNNPKALRTLHKELARQTLLLKKELLKPIPLSTLTIFHNHFLRGLYGANPQKPWGLPPIDIQCP